MILVLFKGGRYSITRGMLLQFTKDQDLSLSDRLNIDSVDEKKTSIHLMFSRTELGLPTIVKYSYRTIESQAIANWKKWGAIKFSYDISISIGPYCLVV